MGLLLETSSQVHYKEPEINIRLKKTGVQPKVIKLKSFFGYLQQSDALISIAKCFKLFFFFFFPTGTENHRLLRDYA